MKKGFLLTGMLALSIVLAACGSPAPTAAPTAAPTEPPAPAFPTGKFADSENDKGGFVFNADGTWESYNGIYTLAKGTYSSDGSLYIEETSNSDCPAPMSFQYTFDGTNLTFQLTEESKNDPCDGRRSAFDNKTYILSQE